MNCDPTDAAPPFNLANLFRATGRKIKAKAALLAATRADPTFAEAWYNLSDLLDEQGRSEAARSVESRCSAQPMGSGAEMDQRVSASRLFSEWSDDDYDVIVGRIMI